MAGQQGSAARQTRHQAPKLASPTPSRGRYGLALPVVKELVDRSERAAAANQTSRADAAGDGGARRRALRQQRPQPWGVRGLGGDGEGVRRGLLQAPSSPMSVFKEVLPSPAMQAPRIGAVAASGGGSSSIVVIRHPSVAALPRPPPVVMQPPPGLPAPAPAQPASDSPPPQPPPPASPPLPTAPVMSFAPLFSSVTARCQDVDGFFFYDAGERGGYDRRRPSATACALTADSVLCHHDAAVHPTSRVHQMAASAIQRGLGTAAASRAGRRRRSMS